MKQCFQIQKALTGEGQPEKQGAEDTLEAAIKIRQSTGVLSDTLVGLKRTENTATTARTYGFLSFYRKY